MKNKNNFSPDNIDDFKLKMLHWASQFSIFCFLDNSKYQLKHHAVDCMLAAGAKRFVQLQGKDSFASLQSFYETQPGWLFGHLGYNLTRENDLPQLDGFAPGFFFEPNILICIKGGEVSIEENDGDQSATEIYNSIITEVVPSSAKTETVNIKSRLSKEEYLDIIVKIKGHIHRGDCYELNFCQEFFAPNSVIDTFEVYNKLQKISPNPFAAMYKVNDSYCMCASPERYMQKKGQAIISQPIKGTSKRNEDPEADKRSKEYLETSAKERSENVMIVDLVRNDLSKVCEEGTVEVEEMFGIYSFPQVYQMISTIKGTLAPGIHFTKALEAAFPMGSMTGAPKKKVMELIERYESGPRGLFSGSIGYIDPKGDFDFNVIIRSIFYNSTSKYVSYWAGGGITFHSEPLAEYEECMAKVEAIKKALC